MKELDPGELHLFLSYTRREEKVTHQLKSALEDQGHECWAYLLNPIEAADDLALGDALLKHILRSDAVIVVASNHALSRDWIQKEIAMATTRLRRVLLVVVEFVGELSIPAGTVNNPEAQWITYDALDPVDGARRAIERLRDDRPWGTSQKLRWIE